jgi:predicted  nucleic acid-binding Zn-ribbon protein
MADIRTESEIAVLKSVVTRLDNSIATMSEVSVNISKLLAAHEERINNLEKNSNEVTFDIRDVHSRISTMTKEILDKLDESETKLEQKIKESNISTSEHLKELQLELHKLDERVSFVERWKWSVVGGAIAVGWLIWAIGRPAMAIIGH